MIARHVVDVANADGSRRRVHYRRAGSGPPVLLVHQSPRSSAEYLPLIGRWAQHFTVIAPDTPGFGDSAPLPHADPECADYADALVALLDALGLPRVAAYGFHSGAIILVTAARRHAGRFSALACGGYAVWTEAERADFAARYTPPFEPLPFGEHLAWLWGRLLEQGWFFPWYCADPDHRLPMAHGDPARVQPIVLDCLAAGGHFQRGYRAVLRARRDVPGPGEPTPPVLIAAHDGDPLQAHLDRLGPLPANWAVQALPTPEALEAAALDWLQRHATGDAPPAVTAADEGFVRVAAAGFDGLVHWRGEGPLWLHAPGAALADAPAGRLALDLPGHGLSDPWDPAPDRIDPWADVVVAALGALGARPQAVGGNGWSTRLAAAVAARLGVAHAPAADPPGPIADWRAHGIPDLTPDWAGAHLLRGWRMLRAAACFAPWFQPAAATARAFSAHELSPALLHRRHLALLRASAARPLLAACLDAAGPTG